MNDIKNGVKRFHSALYPFSGEIKEILLSLPESVKAQAQEIRVRSGKPLMLTVGGVPMWVTRGAVSYLPPHNIYTVSPSQVEALYLELCNRSVYSHTDEISEGFIVMKDSHRAGVCGTKTAVGLRDISSVNIRIAREIIGCADEIFPYLGGGMLICGAPGSGKTTLLRDAVRQLSTKQKKRVCVIDTRGEIAAVCGSVPQNDLGDNTDVLTGIGKAKGIEMAVRTMFPDFVAFDEIGSHGEVDEVIKSLSCGVSVLTTAHIGNIDELKRRELTSRLLESGAIEHIAFLRFGEKIKIKRASEV